MGQSGFEIIKQYIQDIPATGIVVEIGTGDGGTACILKNATAASIHTIDPNPGYNARFLQLLGITQLPVTSEVAALEWDNGTIDLLIVDGGHDFKSIITDIISWIPHLSLDAVVIFDDYESLEKGGIANLAVKICLDSLRATGVLTVIDLPYKFLIAKISRSVIASDIAACIARFHQLTLDEHTYRADVLRIEPFLYSQHWEILNYLSYNDRISFRRWTEAYKMLLLAIEGNTPEINTIATLSQAIAAEQVKLNILREIFDLLLKEQSP